MRVENELVHEGGRDYECAACARAWRFCKGHAMKSKCISEVVSSGAAGLPLRSKRREALCSAHMFASEPSSPLQHLGMHHKHGMRT